MPVHLCPTCGSQEPIVNKLHKVGCAHCYSEFFSTFKNTAEWYHGKNYHIGKMPLDYSGRPQVLRELYTAALSKAQTEGRTEDANSFEILLAKLGSA